MSATRPVHPDLRGRVAAVTGGGRGLGLAMARHLAANGAHVLVGSISEQESEEAAELIRREGGTVEGSRLDVINREECEAFVARAVDRFGRLDIMMCNAGISIPGSAFETDAQAWDRTLAIDLTGVFNTALAAGRHMVKAGTGGAIVVTSSTAARVAFEGLTAYCAAKGGVEQLVRSLAAEWGPHGIRVNAVAPGWTSNRMQGNEAKVDRSMLDAGIDRTPLRRVGEVDEIAAPAVFLASDAASFITGAVLVVDGGYTAA
ncbi:MAG: SDR family NAD(P)-dependent oxidoreductase [Parvibaculaceae bacterium]